MAKTVSRLENPISFIAYQARRALKHPGIFLQVRPFELLEAEMAFRNYRMPLNQFVSIVTRCSTDQVGTALTELSLPMEVQKHTVRECLFAIVRLTKPCVTIETGCGGGYGASYILAAMKLNDLGRLYSVDSESYYDPEYFDLPPGTPCGGVIPSDLRGRWELHTRSSEVDLPKLFKNIGMVDMFVHDSLHTRENMEFEYNIAWEYLRPGGILISHDIWMPWVDFARKVNRTYVVYQHYGAMIR